MSLTVTPLYAPGHVLKVQRPGQRGPAGPPGNGGEGGGVANVAAGSLAPLFTTAVSNPTGNASISFTQVPKAKNKFFAGPISGADANPDFRFVDPADLSTALAALWGLTPAADRLPYFTSGTAAALATLTAAARGFLAAVDAAAQRTSIGLGTASNVQFNNATLTGTLTVSTESFASITLDGFSGEGVFSSGSIGGNVTINNGTVVAQQAITASGFNASSQRIINVAEPVSGQDVATKNYVDLFMQGLRNKGQVRAATTANITLSGLQTVDSVVLIAGDVVCVKDQSNPAQNGLYVAAAGAWTRAPNMDVWGEVVSAFVWIDEGTANKDTGWLCTSDSGGTLGTTPITWTKFGGLGTYTNGVGIDLTGNSFSLSVSGVTAGTYGSGTKSAVVTTDKYGRITTVSETTIAPSIGSVAGLGSGVAAALGKNAGASGGVLLTSGGTLTGDLSASGWSLTTPGALTITSLAFTGGGVFETKYGGLGADCSKASGVPKFDGGVVGFLDTTGNGKVVLSQGALIKAIREGEQLYELLGYTIIDCSLSNNFAGTLTDDVTLDFTSVPSSGEWYRLTLDIYGNGINTVTWPRSVDWGDLGAPSTVASGKFLSVSIRTRDGGIKWIGQWIGGFTA